MFDKHVDHLTVAQNKFLRHWDRLIDLEAKVSQATRQEILHPQNIRGERSTNNLSSIILDVSNGFSVDGCMKDGRFIYNFVCQKLHCYDSKMPSRGNMDPSTPCVSSLDCSLRCGDRVVWLFVTSHGTCPFLSLSSIVNMMNIIIPWFIMEFKHK